MDNLHHLFAPNHTTPEQGTADGQFVMLKTAPPVDQALVERADVSALEVTIAWGNNVLHVAHLTPLRSFYLGEEGGDFLVPQEALGAPRVPVVVVRNGVTFLVVPSGAEGKVMDAAGSTPLDLLPSEPSAEHAGAKEILLVPGQRATLELAGLTLHVAAVKAGKAASRTISGREGRVLGAYFGVSFLVHAAFIAAMAHFVPPVGLLDDEGANREQLYLLQASLAAAAEREHQRQEQPVSQDEAGAPEQEEGQRAVGDEGKMGKVTSNSERGRYGVKGPRDNPDPHLARTREYAASFGMVGLLAGGVGDPDAPTATFGRDSALGRDDLSADGNMWGDSIHEAGGAGGLGLSGLGQQGGGFGAGIGLGDIGGLGGLVGRCNGAGCEGMGNGFARGTGTHVARAPRIRPEGVTETSGRLPAETIQRVVRQNFGQFRMCYENGLRANPNLAGRIAVRFVISSDGRVTNAANGGSDLPDSGVVSCVVRGFYSLGFPAPESGVVTVVYPIQFSPG
ncbi:MAG: AgmX/PglI C-terminal domain-containing protein [Polyangiaceae bacterium]|nr:AgmX/PglI C-terminal domain-containing protein [Polyangiaceae bacterium]MCW5790401.1 AgmX/PglI C-terminal domain-containing protein [Polyangiaceae bacterium]